MNAESAKIEMTTDEVKEVAVGDPEAKHVPKLGQILRAKEVYRLQVLICAGQLWKNVTPWTTLEEVHKELENRKQCVWQIILRREEIIVVGKL